MKRKKEAAMKIFLAGATGAIGRRLVPMLVAAGHTVTGTTHYPDKMMLIHSAGATPMLMNALNEKEVFAVVQRAQPEIIIHQLTAIPANLNLRRFDEGFELTNRLRTAELVNDFETPACII
jgi:nucleoside-diphosphate-sugar epimerase